MSEYTIAGGSRDADRLARQAGVMAAATAAFLARAGPRPGWSCLDVGCGGGQVTIEPAGAVGPRGRVVGLDVDEAALEIAPPGGGARRGGGGVRPRRCDVAVGGRRVRPRLALDRLQDLYGATVRAHGGDPTIGPRLPALLAAAGVEDVQEATVENPMPTVEGKLFLVELLDNMRGAMLAACVAGPPELNEVGAEVDRAARDPGTLFHQARIHQVHGRRPRG